MERIFTKQIFLSLLLAVNGRIHTNKGKRITEFCQIIERTKKKVVVMIYSEENRHELYYICRWAFSIWGAIFVLQGLGVIVTVLRRFEDPDGARQRYANAVALPWILGWVLASGWQLLFAREHVEYMPLATLCILGSFASLMAGLLRLYRQHKQFGSPGNLLLYAAYFLPTSIMTSWLSGMW